VPQTSVPLTAEDAMTTHLRKPATPTSHRADSFGATQVLRRRVLRSQTLAVPRPSAGTARRFLSVLLAALSAWTV